MREANGPVLYLFKPIYYSRENYYFCQRCGVGNVESESESKANKGMPEVGVVESECELEANKGSLDSESES